ncbi:MAG: RtcB family protein [Anaerolineae bacterium]|nr:RtcB family protein [Anaerolineae bacterium]
MIDGNDILRLGYPEGKAVGLALAAAQTAAAEGLTDDDVLSELTDVLNAPQDFIEDPTYGRLAGALIGAQRHREHTAAFDLTQAAPYKVWGTEGIEAGALDQMKRAVRLPVAVRGALMPDAHQGYGLPIGGVLATHESVIPYAVGVDIACRMRMTVFNTSPYILDQQREKFRVVLQEQTRFGVGSHWEQPHDHAVMDDPAWTTHPVARQFKDVAWRQLGSSGSGNHFVEFGALNVHTAIDTPQGTIPQGTYLAVLSHSGSRRFGLEMANHYTKVAMNLRVGLPKDFKRLAWLQLDEHAGAEYWAAMTLAGKYASANHAVIHRQIVDVLRMPVLGGIENHHNYAWKERVDGQEVVVHRKGATPAGKDVLGVIPGSMSAPGFVVRGLGNADAINSAAHGAGRRMSRKQAFQMFNWESVRHKLKAQGVELLSAGLDEAPGAYKDIRQVMQDQHDLVIALAEFQPKLVKMAPGRGPRRDRKRSKKRKRSKGRDPRRK